MGIYTIGGFIDASNNETLVSHAKPLPVSGLVSKGEALAAGTAYRGFRVDVVGTTAWTFTFTNGGTVSFNPVAGEIFDWDGQFTVIGTGGSGAGYLP